MKKLILALMLSVFVLGLGATSAMADSIMFPWVSKNTNVTTLISVVQTSEITATCRQNAQNTAQLHYQYWYKPACHPSSPAGTCVANLTGICEEHDIFVPTSQNDIVSFDAAGNMNTGKPLFNDYPGYRGTVDYGTNVDFSLATVIESSARAFLLVDNNNDCFSDWDEATLYGEAIIFELDNGAGWGYVAYNGVGGGMYGPNDEPTLGFMDGADLQGEVLRSPRWDDSTDSDEGEELEATPTVLLPLQKFKTKMFMTPTNYARSITAFDPEAETIDFDGLSIGARNGASNARLMFCTNPETVGSFPRPDFCGTLTQNLADSCQSNNDALCTGGIYDNDEGIISCQTCRVNVVCTAALDISADPTALNGSESSLLNSSQKTYLTTYGGQAWTYVRSMVGSFWPVDAVGGRNPNTMSDMIVGKLEYTEGPINISGEVIGGEINDFKWIRNSGSLWLDGTTMGDWPVFNWDMARGINQVIQSDGFGD